MMSFTLQANSTDANHVFPLTSGIGFFFPVFFLFSTYSLLVVEEKVKGLSLTKATVIYVYASGAKLICLFVINCF